MSTYLYLVCPSHDEPVAAANESGQHHRDLTQIRTDWARREHWLAHVDLFPNALTSPKSTLGPFQRHTVAFIAEHRNCPDAPFVETEYGIRYPIDPAGPDSDDLDFARETLGPQATDAEVLALAEQRMDRDEPEQTSRITLTDHEERLLASTLATAPGGHLGPWVETVTRIIAARLAPAQDLAARWQADADEDPDDPVNPGGFADELLAALTPDQTGHPTHA